jgi:DNA-binding XRE family transcriptional regulator
MNEVNEALGSIGKMFRMVRKDKDMTLKDVAKITNLRPATIAAIERGETNWQIITVMKIASALECYLDITMVHVEK